MEPCRVLVSNLPFLATVEDVRTCFSSVGTVVDVRLMDSEPSQLSRSGSGISDKKACVTFDNEMGALSAISRSKMIGHAGLSLKGTDLTIEQFWRKTKKHRQPAAGGGAAGATSASQANAVSLQKQYVLNHGTFEADGILWRVHSLQHDAGGGGYVVFYYDTLEHPDASPSTDDCEWAGTYLANHSFYYYNLATVIV